MRRFAGQLRREKALDPPLRNAESHAMEEARLKAALDVMAAYLAEPEEDMVRTLVARGYTQGEASRLAAFVPMAFARPILE